MSEFRIGYVSSIDYENGLCEVHYPDRDDTVTEKVPFISNREYRMPEVEDLVGETDNVASTTGPVAATSGRGLPCRTLTMLAFLGG